jgi:nitroreductase/NAD-dependent dihydropyrimidine dehydrogenase PreA subunit
MLVKEIDRNACRKCGECARICANSRVIEMGGDGYPVFAREASCIHCGHCLAICPAGAISFSFEGEDGGYLAESRELGPGAAGPCATGSGAAGPEYLLRTLDAARSCRFFRTGAVEKEKLDRILEAMVRSPSAGNEQNRSFYVFGSKAKVDSLEADTAASYRGANAKMASPFMLNLIASSLARKDLSKTWMRNRAFADMPKSARKEEYKRMLSELAERSSKNQMSYYNGATAAILITSRTNAPAFHRPFYKADVEIAVTYGSLAAAALGLGSCRMGLSEIAFGRDRAMKAKYGILPNERVDGILALGYTELEWKRLPPRGPVAVTWM